MEHCYSNVSLGLSAYIPDICLFTKAATGQYQNIRYQIKGYEYISGDRHCIDYRIFHNNWSDTVSYESTITSWKVDSFAPPGKKCFRKKSDS